MLISETSNAPSSRSGFKRDPYHGVIIVLAVASLLGTAGALAGGLAFGNRVLLDTAVTLGISTAILIGVVMARTAAARPRRSDHSDHEVVSNAPLGETKEAVGNKLNFRVAAIPEWISPWLRDLAATGNANVRIAAAGVLATGLLLLINLPSSSPNTLVAGIAGALCFGAAGLAATAARYLADIEPDRFPESSWLCRGARVIAWILVLAAVSMGVVWAGQRTVLLILHAVVLTVNLLLCFDLFAARRAKGTVIDSYPLDFGVLSILGSRTNILASILDAAEQRLGIDLRSTWALTVVRRGLEPLVIGLCLMGWLSTSLTVVATEEQGLIERLGVPLGGPPLAPGLHLHWPWPIDKVFRLPVLRVQALAIGHEGAGRSGPEDVLWTVDHVPNEYTLLLGDGRDLITVDAAVQFRIADARAWRYGSQNPADALRAIAYRVVMRSTANRTLSQALSENVVVLTGDMRAMVQQEAEALGLGVEIVGFTVGAMHPPVRVADAYEAVVSSELKRVTAVVNAQAFRNKTVPAAEASAVTSVNAARAESSKNLARAAGEAWSFRALESQHRAAPQEYFFRRRLETIETGLSGRRFTVVDSRFQRDGGELWLTQ